MSKRTQNPIYIATTISVYLGLVLVGASPQVLGHNNFTGETQSRIFELTSQTNSVLSKLKLRQENDSEQFQTFAVKGSAPDCEIRWCLFEIAAPDNQSDPGFNFTNDQILTVSNLPRASI